LFRGHGEETGAKLRFTQGNFVPSVNRRKLPILNPERPESMLIPDFSSSDKDCSSPRRGCVASIPLLERCAQDASFRLENFAGFREERVIMKLPASNIALGRITRSLLGC
jgi:hypothetical protein